jgi:hypothetical protein
MYWFFTFYLAVTYPLLGIAGKFEGVATRKSLHIDIEASYEKHKFESELSAKTGVHKAGDYEVEFEVCNIHVTFNHNYSEPWYNFKTCVGYFESADFIQGYAGKPLKIGS